MQKNRQQMLAKLGIEQLNVMQEEALLAIEHSAATVLLSPTGSGKTLAFLLPILNQLDLQKTGVQALILTPSRELAIQIEQVARSLGSGFKINLVYGGRPIAKDFAELQQLPAILIGTPGRVADHLRRGTVDGRTVEHLILDEFDKSLEIGFTEEMEEIISLLPQLERKVLTSATQAIDIPAFVGLYKPVFVNHLDTQLPALTIKRIVSPEKDKLQTLLAALQHLGNQPGIVFCNYKDSIQRISDFLSQHGISHACFYGGLEQKERERALIQFRNGSHQLLLATDLAARGIDVPDIQFIIHYHLPYHAAEFTHRNGRTARMKQEGTAYVLHWANEDLPDFIGDIPAEQLQTGTIPSVAPWATLFLSGGRQDKISKGDIAGFLFKQGQLNAGEVGVIELKQDCAFVAVSRAKAEQVVQQLDHGRLKKRKLRVKLLP